MLFYGEPEERRPSLVGLGPTPRGGRGFGLILAASRTIALERQRHCLDDLFSFSAGQHRIELTTRRICSVDYSSIICPS